MIREEQRTAQIMEIASLRYEDCEKYSAFISGAMWADNNPTQDIVNLNDVWHDASEEPQDKYTLIITYTEYFDPAWWVFPNPLIFRDDWKTMVSRHKIRKWAYLSDLLPKKFIV